MNTTKEEQLKEEGRQLQEAIFSVKNTIYQHEIDLGIRKSKEDIRSTMLTVVCSPILGGIVSVFADVPNIQEFCSTTVLSTGIILGGLALWEAKEFIKREAYKADVTDEEWDELRVLKNEETLLKMYQRENKQALLHEDRDTYQIEKEDKAFQKALGGKPFNTKHS